MKKNNVIQRREIYQEMLKKVISCNLDGLCVELGDKLPKGFCSTPTNEIINSFPEFFLFHSQNPITQFSAFWETYLGEKKEREYRIFILQLCIEMCNG